MTNKLDVKPLEQQSNISVSVDITGEGDIDTLSQKLSSLPILTKFKNGYKLLDYELRVTTIYSMILNNTELIRDEYKSKVIIK